MRAIARRLTSRGWAAAIALLAVIGSVLVIGLVGSASREALPTDTYPNGSDSRAAVELAQALPGTDSMAAVVVFSRDSDKLTPADLAFAKGRLAAASSIDGVKAAGPAIPSQDGTSAVGTLTIDGTAATVARDKVAEIRTVLQDGRPDGLSTQVTGPAGISADLAKVFDGANFRLLGTTALVVALLLIITYRSPVLWLIPLTIVGLADQVAASAATHVLNLFGMTYDQSTTGILSVLVFGAGTDYALLLISRYRDELKRYEDRREAMAVAWRRTVETVTSSAATVFVGLLSIVLSLFPATRGLGLACAIGVVVAATFVMIALPSALVCFGRWVFWPRIPKVVADLVDRPSLWRRVGDAVAKRPAVYAAATFLILVLAALPIFGVTTGLSQSDQFIKKPEAIAAGERIAKSFSAGSVDPTRVYTKASAADVMSAIKTVPAVDSVRPGATGGGVTELVVTLKTTPSSAESKQAIRDLRAALGTYGDTHVGGTEARALDVTDASARDRSLILPLILGFVLLALVVLLRSVVAPVLLVGTVLVTYVASFGVSWLLFTGVIGFSRLDDSTPLLAFVFLVALGVDYNIFLVSRALEEARTHGTREAMIRSLAATGGVITSAGVLLAAVFAVLGVLPLVALAQIGVIICVGVLLDTLVVRTVLVPALALVLGDAFWWPRKVGHEQPSVENTPEPEPAPIA